jgi:alanyl-tRNA synthetase
LQQQKDRARAARPPEVYDPESIKTAHTGAHLLNAALRQVLGESVRQAGQKIAPRQIRHDFTLARPLSGEEIKQVEELVREKIAADLPVTREETTLEKAKQEGAEALFEEKYRRADKVTLYRIGDFSKELCGGPHAARTGELKSFKIEKQAAVGRGVRRLYAAVEG